MQQMPLDWISGVGTSQVGNTHALNSEGGGSSQPTGSQSAAGGNPNAIVVLSNTQKSSTSCKKGSPHLMYLVHRVRKKVCLPTSQSFILCSLYLKLILALCN